MINLQVKQAGQHRDVDVDTVTASVISVLQPAPDHQGERTAMHDLLPKGEELKRAVKWVSSTLMEQSGRSAGAIVQEAIFIFDLSPRDAEFLIEFFRDRKTES